MIIQYRKKNVDKLTRVEFNLVTMKDSIDMTELMCTIIPTMKNTVSCMREMSAKSDPTTLDDMMCELDELTVTLNEKFESIDTQISQEEEETLEAEYNLLMNSEIVFPEPVKDEYPPSKSYELVESHALLHGL
jgi:hypothetical protein